MTDQRFERRTFLRQLVLGTGGLVLLAACQQTPAPTPVPVAPTSAPAHATPPPTATTAIQPTVAANSAPTTVASSSTGASVDRAGWPTIFTLGLFAGDDPNAVLNSYAPLSDYLQKQVGLEFKSVTGTSYSAVIEAMHTN